MVGFSTNPQRETNRRPEYDREVKRRKIKSCLIINRNENRVLTAQVVHGQPGQ